MVDDVFPDIILCVVCRRYGNRTEVVVETGTKNHVPALKLSSASYIQVAGGVKRWVSPLPTPPRHPPPRPGHPASIRSPSFPFVLDLQQQMKRKRLIVLANYAKMASCLKIFFRVADLFWHCEKPAEI